MQHQQQVGLFPIPFRLHFWLLVRWPAVAQVPVSWGWAVVVYILWIFSVISCRGADSVGRIRASRRGPLCFALLEGVAAAKKGFPECIAEGSG